MLIRSTWTLTVSEPTTLPRSYGLKLVKDLHQRAASQIPQGSHLEMGNEIIPSVTCSGILGKATGSGDFVTFHAGEFYQLSLCGLQERASKAIASLTFASNPDLPPTLELLGAKFHIVNRDDEVTSYENLYHTLVAAEPEPEKRFDLKFTTPTAFSQNRIYLSLPLPSLMFRSWLERWNHFAPVYLGSSELIQYLSENIAVSRHNIQTRSFPVHSGRVTGFVGTVTLQILSLPDPLLANVANLLIRYAQFAGTGMKTRLGMGQTLVKTDRLYIQPES
ncbi:MAG: CRISPR system precrRNA processing endoribonuclease RAMP protein Cas6 [Leptolyngbyaceae cyanobacterium RM2_2_4]|nr:CRISPR system precrRNA processing endoribonuclease RAMP protein Cas6 [Leptolyngbyaceae cyanobacterium SM1_4_3]NJO49322.1 CRISPR system precrRNA processing endoribonuclease RAMP protein Cas6 [Leptolyngbyaceae cyanobacterium RM2_2_4]